MNYVQEKLIKSLVNYPEMEVQDALKFIFQSEFGCGHLIKDEEKSCLMLEDEWEKADLNKQEELFEQLGGGYARFNIGIAKGLGISPRLFQRIFFKSAEREAGTVEGFYNKVSQLKKMCEDGEVPFSVGEVEEFLEGWEEKGQPLFRHSDKYRMLYKPSYRVVSEEFISILPVIIRIENELKQKEKVVIGIDGPCGAGKTTLANKLADFYGVQIVHMDDFFLPPSLRSVERLEEPGGNIHYERFCEEVVSKVKLSQAFKYRVFSCRKMDFHGEAEISNSNLLIVEGSYSLHPLFEEIYDIKIFCDIDLKEQKRRIISRNGMDLYRNFEIKWIPMEKKYFKEFNIEERCDYVLS